MISSQPTSVTVPLGTNVSFTVGANGSSLKYQWRFNTTNIPGATASAYSIASVDTTNAGNYSVLVTNSTGNQVSSYAYLSIQMPPTNALGATLAPPNMANWWDGQADTADSFGTVTLAPTGNFYYQPGQPGLGLHFDGSTTYLTNNAASLSAPWTLMFWVNRQNADGASAGFLSDGSYTIKLEQYNGTRQVGITHAGFNDATFGYIVPQNTWTHLALVGTSTGTSLYVNGALQTSITNSEPLPRKYMGISYFTSGGVISDYMRGTVDEIVTFTRALSGTEISTVYSAGSAGLVRAPELTSIGASATSVTLNMRGITGKQFSIYRSPDLDTWTFLNRVSSSTGTLQYSDLLNGAPQNFYKVTQP
jgi:hypothetical protein